MNEVDDLILNGEDGKNEEITTSFAKFRLAITKKAPLSQGFESELRGPELTGSVALEITPDGSQKQLIVKFWLCHRAAKIPFNV